MPSVLTTLLLLPPGATKEAGYANNTRKLDSQKQSRSSLKVAVKELLRNAPKGKKVKR